MRDSTRRVGQALALALVAGVLAAQTVAIVLPVAGASWPFLRYSMYATPGSPDFSHSDVCVTLGDRSVSVQGRDLGFPTFAFMGVLRRVREDSPTGERARARLGTRVAQYIGPGARIDVWRATWEMGPEGLRDAAPPWELERSWTAPEAGAFEPLATMPPRVTTRGDRLRSGHCEALE